MFNIYIFFSKTVQFEIMWKNTVEQDRPQITIWRMRIACWVSKATDTQYVILMSSLQQRLHESASLLRYTYIACLVNTKKTRVENTALFTYKHIHTRQCTLQQTLLYKFTLSWWYQDYILLVCGIVQFGRRDVSEEHTASILYVEAGCSKMSVQYLLTKA